MYKEVRNPFFERQFQRCCIFNKWVDEFHRGTFERIITLQSRINVGQVGLALKVYRAEHEAYPDSLEEVAPDILKKIPEDPFTGKGLVYKKSGDGFVLYSLGPDLQDNHGAPLIIPAHHKADEKLPPYGIVWKSEN